MQDLITRKYITPTRARADNARYAGRSTPTRVKATAVITDLGGDYSVTVTGTYIRTLPLTKSLTNCTSKEPLPDYVDFDSLITVELDANPNTEFHTDGTTYLSVKTRIGGREIKTPFTISGDKKKATISYQLENSGNYSRVNIVGECFPVEVVGKEYGSINVYLVTLDNLKEFAAKRYFTDGGEMWIWASMLTVSKEFTRI